MMLNVLKDLASEGMVHEALDMIEGTPEQKEEQVNAVVEGIMTLSESIPADMFKNIVQVGRVA